MFDEADLAGNVDLPSRLDMAIAFLYNEQRSHCIQNLHHLLGNEQYMEERVGQQLGNYRLVRFLGEGGFAEVYLGEHIELGTMAAIKLLHLHLSGEDSTSFRTEARTIAHLVHPHIVRVLDFGSQSRTPYLVMDYAPNGTLRQRHPKGTRLPLSSVISYVKQAATALQYAHDQKLIHRDIKPENMLLNRNNDILLSDFGLATIARSTARQNTETIAGTAIYMAPEMFTGKAYAASDQYSLGIVVYEWLAGHPPFYEGNFIQLGYQHSKVEPDPLSMYVPTIPKSVEEVLNTALAKDYKRRFESVQAFANALEQASQPRQVARERRPAGPSQGDDVHIANNQPFKMIPLEDRTSPYQGPPVQQRPKLTPPIGGGYTPPIQNPGKPLRRTRSRSSVGIVLGVISAILIVGIIFAVFNNRVTPLFTLIVVGIGLITGFLASIIMRGGGYGLIGDIVAGLIGAFMGGELASLVSSLGLSIGWIGALIFVFIGACVFIGILRLITHRS